VLNNGFGQPATRVAIACMDAELCRCTTTQLERAGAVLAVHSDLASFAAIAKQCDVALIFADGLWTTPLLACIASLESLRGGPGLIVVADPDRPGWVPRMERERSATLVTRPTWAKSGLDLVRTASRSAWVVVEDSRPELPFTD